MVYGEKRDYKKIEIFVLNSATGNYDYRATTTWSPTLKDAKERWAKEWDISLNLVHVAFAEK